MLAAPSSARPDENAALGARVAEIIVTKCAECHVEDADDVRARRSFDGARDLARVIDELVEPGDPDLSDLWIQIEDDLMPPEDSAAGPLSPEERDAVRSWIVAGAPLPQPTVDEPDAPPVDAPPPAQPAQEPATKKRALGWLGRFHPLVVHFPIAFLLGAAFLELARGRHGREGFAHASRVLIVFGAASALVAAGLGWLNAEFGVVSGGRALTLHRWLGVATAIVAVGLAVASERAWRRQSPPPPMRALALLTALLTAVASHFGGTLVYGPDYLDF